MGNQRNRERDEELVKIGLHFCGHYRNLVKYNPEFCGSCPNNGLRHSKGDSQPSETCF